MHGAVDFTVLTEIAKIKNVTFFLRFCYNCSVFVVFLISLFYRGPSLTTITFPRHFSSIALQNVAIFVIFAVL